MKILVVPNFLVGLEHDLLPPPTKRRNCVNRVHTYIAYYCQKVIRTAIFTGCR